MIHFFIASTLICHVILTMGCRGWLVLDLREQRDSCSSSRLFPDPVCIQVHMDESILSVNPINWRILILSHVHPHRPHLPFFSVLSGAKNLSAHPPSYLFSFISFIGPGTARTPLCPVNNLFFRPVLPLLLLCVVPLSTQLINPCLDITLMTCARWCHKDTTRLLCLGFDCTGRSNPQHASPMGSRSFTDSPSL